MSTDTPVTRARLAKSRVKWESLEFTVTEGLGDLTRMQNEVTRETRECTTIMNTPPAETDDPWTIVIILENLQTSKVTTEKNQGGGDEHRRYI